MLKPLTAYLLHYKKLSIPGVGTLRLVQQPAQLNVADKLILPPSFWVEAGAEDEVSNHQLNFLNSRLNQNDEGSLQTLRSFGRLMRRQMAEGGFAWEGIGTFSNLLSALPLPVAALEPIGAEKVIRQDVSHRMLVGDQEITSAQIADLKTVQKPVQKPKLLISVAWVLLLLSVIGIALLMYFGKFKIGTAGSRLPATVQTAN